MKKLAIFDLDGTLLNTLTDLALSVNGAITAYGYAPVTETRVAQILGYGRVNLIRTASGEENEEKLQPVLTRYDALYAAGYNDHTRPYPGVSESLQTLVDAGVKLAVFSNKPDDMTQLLIAAHFPEIPFTAVFGQRKNVPLKPDPYVIHEICGMAGVEPADVAYFGDSEPDMKVALAAGCKACGVLWGFRPKETLEAAGAQLLLESGAEIAEAVLETGSKV